jgi:hypothetical protein
MSKDAAVAPLYLKRYYWSVVQPPSLAALALAVLKNHYPHRARHMILRHLPEECLKERLLLLSKCNVRGAAHWTAYRTMVVDSHSFKRQRTVGDNNVTYRQHLTVRRCYVHKNDT